MYRDFSVLTLAIALLAGIPAASAQDAAESPPAPAPNDAPVIGPPMAPSEPSSESGPPPPPPPPPAWQPPPPPPATTTPASTERVDGPRFRGGVALTVGEEFVPDVDFSALMVGVDGRLGIQINDFVGLYAEPHLSFGSAGGIEGSTGTFAAIAMVDFTLFDALFVGAGAGYGVFNNPSGPAVALRLGGYPAKGVSDGKPRRRGLMLGLETRMVFLNHGYGTGFQLMGAIGYEAY